MTGYGHVVFDWDGTLCDTLAAKARNAANVLAGTLHSPPAALVAAYLRHSGVARRVLFDRIALDVAARPLADDEFERASAAFTAANLQTLADTSWQPGVRDTLDELTRRQVRLAVSSSAPPEDLDPRVARSGLRARFDAVLGTRPGMAKGAEHVAALAARWGVAASAILFVGDEAADVTLARSAGARSAIVTHTLSQEQARAAGADHVLPRIEDLLPLCARP